MYIITTNMAKNLDDFKIRVNQLIDLADRTSASEVRPGGMARNYVDTELFFQFRSAVLSFISNLYGEDHAYFRDFQANVSNSYPGDVKRGRGILASVKSELDGGWLVTMKGLVSAEIFTDFLEMAEHLLKEKYKDAAAVMIGSVLEEHIRQLCTKNSIAITTIKDGKPVAKKADLMNSELGSAGVYNKLDQKSVTTWLDLRNKAAHGKYSEYTQSQVELMLQGVTDFIARNAI